LAERYYGKLSSPLKNRLLEFRSTHRPQQIDCGGESWTYYVGGSGDATVILLPGGLGVAEPWFDCMLEWESHFRVVALSYPCIREMRSAVDAIAATFQREGAQKRYLLGTSLGGEIAQAFLRDRPGELDKVILGNTGAANAVYGKKLERQLPLTRLFNIGFLFSLIKLAAKKRAASILRPYLGESELAFWLAYMNDIIENAYTRDLMQSQFNVLIQFARNYGGGIEVSSSTRMLILEADDDTMFSAERRSQLQASYPGASMKTFPNGGHLLAITRRDEYVNAITSFLLDE
jgi:pimeloyl-ACP methyl ester carboxylesterase